MVDWSAVFAAVVGLAICVFIGYALGVASIKHQAYDRGYMVECLGKEGYYWECGE